MSSIADSNAVIDYRRILTQHHVALTLLNARLQIPGVSECHWLDLACGKGQIISQLSDNLRQDSRSKLIYHGYDINVNHTTIARRISDGLDLKETQFFHGDLSNFHRILPEGQKYDYITCTNTAHELQPGAFASIVLECILSMTGSGEMYIYDMEYLNKPELGALPWRANEIDLLLNTIFDKMETPYRISTNVWSHSNCNGWSVVIQRQHIEKTNDEILLKRDVISQESEVKIDEIIEKRLRDCDKVLEVYCRSGTETADDEQSKLTSLYEYWSLHNAKRLRV